MSNYMRNFDVKNYKNQTTIPKLIANNISGCFFLKHGVYSVRVGYWVTSCKVRNSSGDEIANVNFLYDDIVHVLQNTIDSCINSATDRRGYVLERMFTKFSEITQYNGYYAVQGYSRSPILVPIESSYTTSYINTNLPPISHRFQVMADYSSNFR